MTEVINVKILHLVLKKKWYEMQERGEKTEEYREITPYFMVRLFEINDYLLSKGKEKIKSNRLHGMDKEKFQLYTSILDSLHNCNNWGSFQRRLERRGITISFRTNENGNVYGICFTKDGHTYSGSKIDRSLGYNKLVNVLGKTDQFQQNLQELTPNTFAHVYQEKLDDGSVIRIYEPENTNTDNGPSLGEKLVNAAIEFALQPHAVPSSDGGGGGSSDDEENDKENKNYKPRKFRRR